MKVLVNVSKHFRHTWRRRRNTRVGGHRHTVYLCGCVFGKVWWLSSLIRNVTAETTTQSWSLHWKCTARDVLSCMEEMKHEMFCFLVCGIKTTRSCPHRTPLGNTAGAWSWRRKGLHVNLVVIFRILEIFREEILYLLSISKFHFGRKFCHGSLPHHTNTAVLEDLVPWKTTVYLIETTRKPNSTHSFQY